jgi:type VI secretion system protein ImpH
VEVLELVGQWLDVPEDCCCRLGESPETGSLGWTAIVGSRIWECQQRFRLRFGPMSLAEYERLLPGGQSLRRLIAWLKNYLADQLQWDVQLILKKEEVPPLKMGAVGRLGWTTWLTSRPLDHDADDLVLQPRQAEGI